MFQVGVTRDFLRPVGTPALGEIGLSKLDNAAHVRWEYLPENATELTPRHASEYDALLVLAPRVTAATLASTSRLAVVARFGVGVHTVEVPACTAAGVALTSTHDGVRRPVAVAALTLIL